MDKEKEPKFETLEESKEVKQEAEVTGTYVLGYTRSDRRLNPSQEYFEQTLAAKTKEDAYKEARKELEEMKKLDDSISDATLIFKESL